MRRTASLLFSLTLLLALAGCGSKTAGESGSEPPPGGAGTAAASGSSAGGVEAVSRYDAGPRAADTPIDESIAATGKQLFSTKGCTACHAFGKRMTGPDLAGVSKRRTAAWIKNQILHPDVMTKTDPIAHTLFAQFALQMPKQGLTPDEAAAVVEFFKHNDHEAGESHEAGEQK